MVIQLFTRQEIEQAIAVLENHRDILEDDVVDTAVSALREKQLAIQSTALDEFQQIATILVADLSGFTAMSDLIDAEEIRDTINALWQRLDSVITAWGGQIDQHTGDGVIALFNVISSLPDSVERAVLAGLDMQMELALFSQGPDIHNETDPPGSHPYTEGSMRMRIGIHTGPVLFSKIGTSNQYTAVGDAVTIAKQLERASPIGGILVSDEVNDEIQQNFQTSAQPPILLAEMERHLPVYVVERERVHASQDVNRETSLDDSRFVGRSDELEQLQDAVDAMLDGGTVQFVAILGDAGVGKSRLRIELENLLALQPVPLHVFKGKAESGLGAVPFSAVRNLLANFFDIHRRSSPEVARAKLVNGIVDVLEKTDVHARERAHFIGQLLGFQFDDSPYLKKFEDDYRQIRVYAYQDLTRFFSTITNEKPAVLLLEDMHLADEGSLDLLEYLVQTCADRPLLIIYLARPELLPKWPAWKIHQLSNPHVYHRFNLAPLSAIDSRHLITSRLQSIPRPPLRLVDLLADAAGGNPFLITELVEMLAEIGVIIKGAKQWRVQLSQLNDLQGNLTLEWLQKRLIARLAPLEQAVLEKAAMMGTVFWETAVIQLLRAENPSLSTRQLSAALETLVQQEHIIQNTKSIFPDTREYRFRHPSLHQICYASQSPEQRQAGHRICATWLQTQSGPAPANFHTFLAHHLEQAGQLAEAAEESGLAAAAAQQYSALETAVQYLRRALTLLPETAENAPQRIRFTETLGKILRQQAKFEEAVHSFQQMAITAAAANEETAVIRAYLIISLTQNLEGEHNTALQTIAELEKTNQTSLQDQEASLALVARGWANLNLGDPDQALTLGNKALNISTKTGAIREMAFSYGLLANAGRVLADFEKSRTATDKALALIRKVKEHFWESIIFHNYGLLALARHDYPAATTQFADCLALARRNDNFFSVIYCLRKLSEIARQQDAFETANQHLIQALLLAQKSENLPGRIYLAADLGRLHLAWHEAASTANDMDGHLQKARLWLDYGWSQVDTVSSSLPQVTIQIERARLFLAEQSPKDALEQIKEAVTTAGDDHFLKQGRKARRVCATAWRELGLIATTLPPVFLPLRISSEVYDAARCFNNSIQLFSQLGHESQPEYAQTLLAWADYEEKSGNFQLSNSLKQQVQTIYAQLDLTNKSPT